MAAKQGVCEWDWSAMHARYRRRDSPLVFVIIPDIRHIEIKFFASSRNVIERPSVRDVDRKCQRLETPRNI